MQNFLRISTIKIRRTKSIFFIDRKFFGKNANDKIKQIDDSIESKNINYQTKNFSFDKEEESVQEKYKDFMMNIKEEEAFRRVKDEEFYFQLKKNKLPPTKLASLLMKRNFLKFKEEKSFKPEEERVIELKDLENLKIEDPITLYEIDLNSVTLYKKLDSIVKYYTILAILFNGGFTFSFKMLFTQTTLCYLGTYLSNILLFISILYVNKLKNPKILAIEYLPKDKCVIITKWKYFSKTTQKLKFNCDEIELYESDKFLEIGLNFRMKNNKNINFYLGTDEEGIWHNRKIFDEIFIKK